MKTTSNKDMLNAIRNQASAEYQEKIPAVANDIEARGLLGQLESYPSAKNEFMKALTDKVVKTEFFSKVYSNPLKPLKKGMLPYGATIEEIFVKHAEAKGFFKKDSTAGDALIGNDDAAALIGRKKADVHTLYISKNFAQVFEVSISDAQLKSAFLNANGLSELVNQLVGSLTSGAELREYKDMIGLLKAAAAGFKLETEETTTESLGTLKSANVEKQSTNGLDSNKLQPMETISVKLGTGILGVAEESYAHDLAIKLRATAQRMKFMSSKHNMAKVETFSNIDDLVFLTTPEHMADMDVNVLASAFNISHAEAQLRIIVVDELPKKFAKTLTAGSSATTDFLKPNKSETQKQPTSDDANVNCLGMLIDKNFLQVIDTVNESRQFDNGRALMTNLFLHKQGIMANCYFANAVAFVGEYALDSSK